MIVFACHVCQTPLSADESQAAKLVRCPTCMTTLRVPGEGHGGAGQSGKAQPPAGPMPAPAGAHTPSPGRPFGPSSGGKRYGFNCGYCSSRLEATDAMGGQEGQCPTCGNNITIPILDRYGRLIDPKTRQIIKQDPHPVHAYAAAGDRAPKLIHRPDGAASIQCPRCSAISPVSANNCAACGMPFTMEGTTVETAGTSNGFCVASLVLGIIGLPAFCTIITPLLAIVFGILGLNQVGKGTAQGGGRGMAIAGIICGLVGAFMAAMFILRG